MLSTSFTDGAPIDPGAYIVELAENHVSFII
jgi:hypothetical protein